MSTVIFSKLQRIKYLKFVTNLVGNKSIEEILGVTQNLKKLLIVKGYNKVKNSFFFI
jgi:hypothetical protein